MVAPTSPPTAPTGPTRPLRGEIGLGSLGTMSPSQPVPSPGDPPSTIAPAVGESADAKHPHDEAALIGRLRTGDERAYEHVVLTYSGRLVNTAKRFLDQDEDAQDAVQEAFLSAFRNLDKFQGDSRLYTWLHRIVVNQALMKLRSRRRKPERNIDDLLPRYSEAGERSELGQAWAVTYDTAAASNEVGEMVRGGIDQLPDDYRTILIMRDLEGLNTAETAEALGLSEAAVKTRLHRARMALKHVLDPHMTGGVL